MAGGRGCAIMVLMGRPRTPAKVLEMRGAPLQRPKELQTDPALPPLPDWLDGYATDEWNRVGPRLEQIGIISEFDQGLFAAYCQAYSDVRRLTLEIREEGTVVPSARSDDLKANPKNQLLREAYVRLKDFGVLFGISPVARTKLAAGPGDGKVSKAKTRKRQILSG